MSLQKQTVRKPLRRPVVATLIAFATLALGGCLFVSPPLPPELARVKFVATSSPQVEVLAPRLRMIENTPYLDGSVRRQFRGGSTRHSILKVSCLDTSGKVMQVRLVEFSPAELPMRSLHAYNEGRYQMPLSGLPGEVERIEVTAAAR